MRSMFVATLIIVGLSQVVNAAEHKSLDDLIKEAERSGEATTADGDDVTLGKITAGTPGKGLEISAAEAADGATHDFVVYEKDSRPIAVLFSVIRHEKRSAAYLNLACDEKGKMKHCYRQTGQDDERGKPIAGSAKTTAINSKDREMSVALRHELDFWLKGKYRKTSR